jgi:hypothetical protein
VGAGCQWRARARDDGLPGPRKGGECGRARKREEAWAGSGPAEGGFPFLFLFSISYFYFLFLLSPFLLNK